MKPTINVPYIGCHVWTESGYTNHGPDTGPKVSIRPKSLGMITGSVGQFAGQTLHTVRWNDGLLSKHYFYELDCIGPFDSLDSYHQALGQARAARLWRGPRGGFQMFTAEVPFQGEFYPVQFGKSDKLLFERIEPLLRASGAPIQVTHAPKR